MRCFMMRLLPAAMLVGILQLGIGPPCAKAQVVAGYSPSYRVSDYLGAPGLYGMSYGFASYGMPQTYSVFSAYPGPSYGSNLSALRHPAGAVRRRPVAAGLRRLRGMSMALRTITRRLRSRIERSGSDITGRAGQRIAPPPVGVYAPYLGPSSVYGW